MISFTNFKQWLYLLLDGYTSAFLLSDFDSLLCSTNYRYTGIQLTKSTQTLIKITLDPFYLLTGTGIPSYSILICGL